jgi:hypothetical protein
MSVKFTKEMKYEKTIKATVLEEINGYKIVRTEARKYDDFTGKYSGRTKVYYEIETENDWIDVFKTLAEARRFCMANTEVDE